MSLAVETLAFATDLMNEPLFSYAVEYSESHDVSPPSGRPPWPAKIKIPINANSYAWWDELGEVIAYGCAIIDCAPNILPGLLDWAKDTEPKMNCSIWLLVTATADPKAIEGAADILERSLARDAMFPIARRIFLFNICNGLPAFPAFSDGAPMHRIMSMVESGSCEWAPLMRCESKLLSLAKTRSISLENLLNMNIREPQEKFGLSMPELKIEHGKLHSWFSDQVRIFEKAGLPPKGAG